MSESQYEGILNAINELSEDLQNVKQDLHDFKKDVNAKFDLVNEKINSINDRMSHNQHVQNLLLGNIGLIIGVMTLLFTAIQFGAAYFMK